MKLVLFCLESNQRAQTDWVYINATIRHYFDISGFTIRPIFMNGKGNYDSPKVLRQISAFPQRDFEKVTVVYCVDTDRFETDNNEKQFLRSITSYCCDQGYKFVWFCHDIEEVYLNDSVSDKQKISSARRFASKEEIKLVDVKSLNHISYVPGTSNIMVILNEVFCA